MNSPDGPSASPPKALLHSSPRSSVDAHAPGATPFLQNLQQRFRKGSNASSGGSDPPASPEQPRRKSDANRTAQRFLASVIRDDWEYPSLEVKSGSPIPHREPIAYRRREDGMSDLEPDNAPNRRRSRSDPYKFENPDAVANAIAERKRKRRRIFEEEQEWNSGLRNWAKQRDAWTGALQTQPRPTPPRMNFRSKGLSSALHQRSISDSTDGSSSNRNWPLTGSSPVEDLSPDTTSSIDTSSTDNNQTTLNSIPESDSGPWLPVFPPLLSDEPTPRARITPSAYPTIYSKVVVQSLTPNVPIPLTDMVQALVAGWKAEGAWPPQPATLASQDTKIGKANSAFSRWRREHHLERDGKSGRVRRSIGAVRRVLGVPAEEDALEDLGIEFREQDTEEMEGNVTLNKGLLNDKI